MDQTLPKDITPRLQKDFAPPLKKDMAPSLQKDIAPYLQKRNQEHGSHFYKRIFVSDINKVEYGNEALLIYIFICIHQENWHPPYQ